MASYKVVPEPGDQGSHQQLLREAHARVRGHLESAQFHQTQPLRSRFRRVQLIDTEFGAMGVPGQIDQQVAKNPIDQPGRDVFLSLVGNLAERDLQFVERIHTGFVDPRMLAGGADE